MGERSNRANWAVALSTAAILGVAGCAADPSQAAEPIHPIATSFPSAAVATTSAAPRHATPSTSPASSKYQVSGKVEAQWQLGGGEDVLGEPTADQSRVTIEGVTAYGQRFAKGFVFWSPLGTEAFTYEEGPTLTGVDNARDALAGEGLEGGLLFRSARQMDASLKDQLLLALLLQGGRVIDLRSTPEVEEYPDATLPGVEHLDVPIANTTNTKRFVEDADIRSAFGQTLEDLASDSGPAVVHCTLGRDRTGWLVAMLMYAVGATDEEVRTEYLRTPTAKASKLETGLETIGEEYGSVSDYLTDGLGLSADDLAALKARFG